MRSGAGAFYNTMTVIFIILTLVVALCVILMIGKVVKPPTNFAPETPTLPATAYLPSDTPTAIPSETDTPTYTLTPSKTLTPSRTFTATSTITDTPTQTFTPSDTTTPVPPTKTPIPTKPPTATKTPIPSKTPVPPSKTIDPSLPTKTPPGFPFRIQEGTPNYTANLDVAVGCQFEGIAGQIFGMNNEPLPNVTVNVSSNTGFNQATISGSNPRYGQAGWQVQVNSVAAPGIYTVELRSQQGVPLSPKVQVAFPGTCNQNLALVNFFQTRPY